MFEKEAKERAKDYTDNAKRQVAYECGFLDGVDFVYSKGNEWHKQEGEKVNELEKENAELKEQIEKMKCCEMCKHKNLNWEFSPICEARDKIKIENPLTYKCDKWEIKEND